MSTEQDKKSKARLLAEKIRSAVPAGTRVVFVAGNFNVVHPGHLRLLNFAADCGDYLAVGVSDDTVAGAILPQQMRLDGVQAIGRVDAAFLLPVPAADFIACLKPDIVVKGKEHERHYNPEEEVVTGYGGKLLVAAGESRFSSLDLLQRELVGYNRSAIQRPVDYLLRHDIGMERLAGIVDRFKTLRAIVVGDLIVDEYVTCEPLGMSQEEPTIVVTPLRHDLFVGGAGIVAAHARGLGATVEYFGVAGDDASAVFAEKQLASFGVAAHLKRDQSRPTTLKQRFRAHGKTLLRVSHLRQHDISQGLIDDMLSGIARSIAEADVLIFADFNYGCLPQALVDAVWALCARHQVPMMADSQSSSQVGDISRFQDMLLVTPTEREARLATRDSASGLVGLAESLMQKTNARNVLITLGPEGLFIHDPSGARRGVFTDQLPALNAAPQDVSGAGDSLFACASLALITGASIWESAYLGSIAAACQVGRVGNLPLSTQEIAQEIMQELGT
jgi:rfaE bifunctional protein kinase chain/domain